MEEKNEFDKQKSSVAIAREHVPDQGVSFVNPSGILSFSDDCSTPTNDASQDRLRKQRHSQRRQRAVKTSRADYELDRVRSQQRLTSGGDKSRSGRTNGHRERKYRGVHSNASDYSSTGVFDETIDSTNGNSSHRISDVSASRKHSSSHKKNRHSSRVSRDDDSRHPSNCTDRKDSRHSNNHHKLEVSSSHELIRKQSSNKYSVSIFII